MDRLALLFAGQFEAEAKKPQARRLGYDLETLHDAGHDLVLDRGVEVFSDFADEQDVEVIEPGRDAREVLERADRREETKILPEMNVEILGDPRRMQQLGL